MEEENAVPSVEMEELIELLIERRGRVDAELEELRRAIKVIENQARRLEREIEKDDQLIKRIRTGKIEFSARPAPERFVNMSIPDAAAEAIEVLDQPLHVRELLDLLESGGKRFHAVRPTVSIASALSRDSRFVRVGPNTFDLVERTQPRLPIEE